MGRRRQPGLIVPAAIAWAMATAVVTAEWPQGLVKTVPTRKGTVKLLMQPADGAMVRPDTTSTEGA